MSGYEPLRRNRRRQLEELRSGDGRVLPRHLKAQISRELDRLELLLEQIKAVEDERDELLASAQIATPAPAMLLGLKGIGRNLPRSSGRKACTATLTTDDRLQPMPVWRRHPGRADQLIANRGYRKRAIRDCAQH